MISGEKKMPDWTALKRLLILLAMIEGLLMSGCMAEEGKSVQVALTDQLNRRILVVAVSREAEMPEILYSWTPTQALGFQDVSAYVYPSDVRLRARGTDRTQVLLTCASGGFCAMAAYPSGICLWNRALAPEDNPHAIELLPNGCIAVAASTGGFIRIYPADGSDAYAQYPYMDAHGLLWDPGLDVLWAVGKSKLSAFSFTGTPEAPALTERRDLRAALPIANGHDVFPVYGEPDSLWVIASAPFQYDKVSRKWIRDYDGANLLLSQTGTKSCGSADGLTVRTMMDGTWQIWDTATLSVLYPGADAMTDYVFTDAAIYRARIWKDAYQ